MPPRSFNAMARPNFVLLESVARFSIVFNPFKSIAAIIRTSYN
jgi:hypothetical protein